jgi:hypothetical protein
MEEEGEEGRDGEHGRDDALKMGVGVEEETNPSPSVINARDTIDLKAIPMRGEGRVSGGFAFGPDDRSARDEPKVGEAHNVNEGRALRRRHQDGRCPHVLFGGVLDEHNAPRMGPSE